MVGMAENMFKMHSTKFLKSKKYFYRGGYIFSWSTSLFASLTLRLALNFPDAHAWN